MIRSAQEIIDTARALSGGGTRRRIAVAMAQDADVISAVRSAYDDGFCDATLVGDEVAIRKAAASVAVDLDVFEIIHQLNPNQAVMAAVELAATGAADAVMKGFVSTSALLKGVLDRRFNLRSSPTLSHVAVLTVPGHDKLMMITDGGMVVKPTLKQRFDILKNSLQVGHALGLSPVKVALSAAADTVDDRLPQTGQDAALVEMVRKELSGQCEVAGPMTFDVAFSPEMARRAGVESAVAGDADVYLVGSIEECNITTKSMIIFGDAIFAGVILGARVPISLVSRTDPVMGKAI